MWNGGCNVRVIYSVTSRPVLSILLCEVRAWPDSDATSR